MTLRAAQPGTNPAYGPRAAERRRWLVHVLFTVKRLIPILDTGGPVSVLYGTGLYPSSTTSYTLSNVLVFTCFWRLCTSSLLRLPFFSPPSRTRSQHYVDFLRECNSVILFRLSSNLQRFSERI